jgi:hypothetical protein
MCVFERVHRQTYRQTDRLTDTHTHTYRFKYTYTDTAMTFYAHVYTYRCVSVCVCVNMFLCVSRHKKVAVHLENLQVMFSSQVDFFPTKIGIISRGGFGAGL